jgi:hypothetical protein
MEKNMRAFSDGQCTITYSKIGLMVLREHFDQRPIEATFSSFRSMVPLATPSGSQQVESELEAELLEQLAFAPGVYDLITQPIIHYEVNGQQRRYTPDIAIQLHASAEDGPCRYIIEVKRRADLLANGAKYAVKFEAGRIAAENMGAAFRIMDETQIRTPYLHNARMLRRHLHGDPELEAFDILQSAVGERSVTVSAALVLLNDNGLSEPDARAGIEQAVAWRMLLCDLSMPFTDSTLIRARQLGGNLTRNADPILRSLFQAKCA